MSLIPYNFDPEYSVEEINHHQRLNAETTAQPFQRMKIALARCPGLPFLTELPSFVTKKPDRLEHIKSTGTNLMLGFFPL